jgi:hypothetical protein
MNSTYVNPSNELNPYDFYGIMHNDKLIGAFNDKININSTNEDIYNYFSIPQNDRIRLDEDRPNYMLNSLQYSTTYATMMNSNLHIKNYAESIRAIIIDESLDLSGKILAITLFENNFNYSLVSNDEATILQVSSSISRYSLSMWAPLSQGGLGYADSLGEDAGITDIDWWEIGVGDFMSACTAAFGTGNPLIALGWGVVSSGIALIFKTA